MLNRTVAVVVAVLAGCGGAIEAEADYTGDPESAEQTEATTDETEPVESAPEQEEPTAAEPVAVPECVSATTVRGACTIESTDCGWRGEIIVLDSDGRALKVFSCGNGGTGATCDITATSAAKWADAEC